MLFEKLFAETEILETNVKENMDILQISSDSRKVRKGSAFVCLKGTKYDGHQWISAALENGASLIVCQEKPQVDCSYVLVKNTRPLLPLLLSVFYSHPEKSFEKIIGITGTNGKTSTSFMIRRIFEEAGMKTGLLGTTKYLIGDYEYPVDKSEVFLTTPDPELFYELLSAMREAQVKVLIMEASSHSLYLHKLENIHFTHAVFTNLTQDHLDFHKTMEEYREAKKTLFRQCDHGIFNADDPSFEEISSDLSCRVWGFSAEGRDVPFKAENLKVHDADGVRYDFIHHEEKSPIFVPIPGKFTVYNSLAAASLAKLCGISGEVIQKALLSMPGVKGRMERVETNTPYSVFIDFAHTPDAMENVLKTLREFTKGRLITLFGCGGDRDKTKRPIMGRIACQMSDFVIVTSDNSRTEEKSAIIEDIMVGVREFETPHTTICDRTEAIHYALSIAKAGDVILLAGKGHEEYEIDKAGKHDYSEKNIVLEYVGAKK